ncbi:MAG: O-antigen ligase family protein [Gemmataceae bacterium]|nr:O-antigen ligase family protein [Gemmataceae bacterium]
MIHIIAGYIYLMVHRPMEIWPFLEPLRIELLYFTLMCTAWCVVWKRLTPDLGQLATIGLGLVVYASWILSPWNEFGEIPVKNYTLVVGFALILSTTLRGERDVHRTIVVFLAVMSLYMLHSVWEFRNGRHVYRMGIVRLVGVDQSLNDPNSFGASMVYALPFVRYLWFSWGRGWHRWLLIGYVLLTIGCIGLTGSRSSLLGLGACGMMLVYLTGRKKVVWLGAAVAAAPLAFMLLPEELRNRFHTIIDPSVGPANAQESGEGRIVGFLTGLEMWGRYPLFGFGPGAWRPATKMPIESHNLYGQLAGELGTAGIVMFGTLLYAIVRNLRNVQRRLRRDVDDPRGEPLYHLVQAIGVSTVLLLLMGVFGHNLYRYNYVWYAAFSSVLVRSYRPREAAVPVWSAGGTGAWA